MVTTLDADRLAEMQDADEEFALVDTRPPESFESWHVPEAINFPFGPEEELDGKLPEFRELMDDAGTDRVVTICAKGISSVNLATQLEDTTDEFEISAVGDGMEGWSRVYDHVTCELGELTVVQLQRRATGCLGYVVGSEEAVVVDPTDDVEEFEAAAGKRDLEIVGVVDTHVHADHVSGGRRLADELDVPYYLGERATDRGLRYEFTPLARNEVLAVGDHELKALATPGHTSEAISLLVDDRALLSADTLHVDSVGRTELEFGEEEGERGARMLYESLHRTLLAEPEGVTVLPGHVSVSADGEFAHGSPGEEVSTTVRAARTGIELLGTAEEAFVRRLAEAGEKPANYEEIIDINRGIEEPSREERLELEMGPNNCSA